MLFRGSPEAIGTTTQPFTQLDETNVGATVKYLTFMYPCGPVIAFEDGEGYTLLVTDLTTLQTTYGLSGDLTGHRIMYPHCVRDSIFLTDQQQLPYSQWVRKPDGSTVKLRSDPNAMVVALGSDGTDMAWMQAYEPDAQLAHWGRIELWTSPFTTDPAQLQPKRLGVTGNDHIQEYPMVVGAGLAAHNVLQGELPRLYRLTDGAYAFAPAVPGLHLSDVISIDEGEILFWASLENAYPTDYITIVRMPLSSLGPFQPLGQ